LGRSAKENKTNLGSLRGSEVGHCKLSWCAQGQNYPSPSSLTWLVINEGPPFVDGRCRVLLRKHKFGEGGIQNVYCLLQPATLLPFAR